MADQAQPHRSHQSPVRTALAGLIGNVLEWFDFAVYGYFATEIGKQFFTAASDTTQHLLAFMVFAIGFIARPVGSVVLGQVGDRIGRRALLTLSISLMGGATLAIGLLPTYAQVGVLAPILLAAMRLIQGFSLGGEFTGSMVYTTELASHEHRGLVSSSTAAGTTIGFILGSGTAYLLARSLDDAQLASWGWRVPFIASVAFCIAGYFLRHNIVEPEAGKKAREERPRLWPSLAADWRSIARLFGITAMTNAVYYLTFTFTIDARKTDPHDGATFQLVNTLMLVVALVCKPLGGWLSDRIGRRKLMLVLTAVMLAAIAFAFAMMTAGSPARFAVGQLMMAVPIGMALGLQGAMAVEIFPLRTRVTSMSVGYSITLALAGGTAPLVSTWLVSTLGHPQWPAYYAMIYGIVGIAIMWPMAETNANELDR
jgi:MFS transporter, MHS family, proline/betaine transporter